MKQRHRKRQSGDQKDLRHSAPAAEDGDSQPKDARRSRLGRAISEARVARGFSNQAGFAKVAGISERSVASAETGDPVGRKVLSAIEFAFDWPEYKTTEYLEGDDDALKAMPSRGPKVVSEASRRLADAGLTIDVVPGPKDLAWLQDLRTTLPYDRFIQVVELLSRPNAHEKSDSDTD